ncbi:MAG: TetR/AcrR family transcriptional regulator C-terminal domain-containing protein [Eubacterium sp.]|nr:TetR/AcrR family transcriptional regulator C-terminal domain-containing protein [Eubacterium sp.]
MKQKTEVLLCKAFMELMKKYPFPKITIQKIASQCGVNRQTFYYHYDNIYDLMTAAFEYELIHEGRMYEEQSWEDVMHLLLNWMRDNRLIMRNIISNIETRYLRQAIYPLIEKGISNEYRPNEIIRPDLEDIDGEFVHRFLILGITQYIVEWVENDFRENIDEMIRQMLLILKKIYG